jgi:Helicase conserved C-terminal domain
MRVVDLKSLSPPLAASIADAKEGVVDALLNLTWQRASGDGPDGAVVFGTKPSLRFVSGFLLPRFEETGAQDETSDIHISTHGMDLQLAVKASGTLVVHAFFAIYVRALPTWSEINTPELDLFPNPSLRPDLETNIRATMRDRLRTALAAEETKPAEQRQQRGQLQQAIYRDLLSEHGVEVSSGAWIAGTGETPGEASDAAAQDAPSGQDQRTDDPTLIVQRGRYLFHNDQAAQELDIPQKWVRLPVNLMPYAAELSDDAAMQAALAPWTARMQTAVAETVRAWLATDEGRDWAYRPATIRPSNFRSEQAWDDLLSQLRGNVPSLNDLAPNLGGLSLTVQPETDLRDPSRRNLRVLLENNSNEVATRRRHRFDHSIHQVRLEVELPAAAHRPLRLDRVEPSYRFRDFLTYAAIGINCGVTESRDLETLRLATTWMPRYIQPRIAPTVIPGVPTKFSILGADRFDPHMLRPLVDAYRDWIAGEERTLNPAAGADDDDQADRERQKFGKDIASYRLEADRIELGIALLEHSFKQANSNASAPEAMPYRAWLLLNRTFGEAGSERGIEGWRLFQLTFVLAHVPTIASRIPAYAKSPWFDPSFDDETATLLYFPTGGGKSEAFFGLVIFNLFLDRLRGKNIGVTALIRYPLRLLTLQQAQRLLAILMRAELLRRQSSIGGAPFEIGFWVGSGNTPNRPDDERLDPVPNVDDPKHRNDDNLGADYLEVNESFNKIPACPICGNHTGLRRVRAGTADEIGIFCFDGACRWNAVTDRSPLPFLIVDRDIYRHAPSVLLGVIDKLALIGQHPATINRVMGMFGFARWQERTTGRLVMPTFKMLGEGPAASNCDPIAPAYHDGKEVFYDPFPSLIIQDEAHLLEESLGTFAGLFETMLEQLLVRGATLLGDRVSRSPFGNRPVRLPKVIAATATVSVPEQQFGALYQRRHMHFPYPGTSIYKSFYAAPAVPTNPARRGIGGNGPRAPEIEAPWMRVYTSIMTNGRNHTVTTVSILAAYHLAISEFWEDLLDPAKRQLAVQRLLDSLSPTDPLIGFHTQGITACANAEPSLLLTLVDLMRISLTYVTNKKGGDQVIDAFREEVAKFHHRYGRKLAHFRNRLISGGVDVAEIQEIMREAEDGHAPGDPFADLDQSLRNIVATSAISHGVDVDMFNAMFFAGMPSDIAEFIQASSRVGRMHVGFSMLIPTPHARRDRYIVETHDVFHRFLERMIAPPAITRWATSAHDRMLTSLFQAWLCGWVEQKLFIERADADKRRAPTFATVSDVGRLFTGPELPGAAKDFMEFAVLALGVPGRGVNRLGAAPHAEYYDGRIRNLAKHLTDELRNQVATTKLGDYWDNAAVGARPMMSLRDIDEAGRFVPARLFGAPRSRGVDERTLVAEALRIVRRQRGRVGELDADDGEG